MDLFLPVIIGTTRPKRYSLHAARFLHNKLAAEPGVTTTLVDPRDYDLSNDGNDEENKIPEYGDIVQRADGFLIVVPEYNRSYPGSLKSLLDKELSLYNHKAAALAGVSAGMTGGARAVQSLLPVLRELGLVTSAEDIFFPQVQNMFDESGAVIDANALPKPDKAIAELLWLARMLRDARQAE